MPGRGAASPFARDGRPAVVGGRGLGAAGLLVKTSGRVTHVDPDGGFFTISDGSQWGSLPLEDADGHPGVRVMNPGTQLPPVGTHVTVTGVGSTYTANAKVYASLKPIDADALLLEYLRAVPVQIIRVSDDDGSRQASTTPADVLQWVSYANNVFWPAGVALIYNGSPQDFTDLKSTLINNMVGDGDANWVQARDYANSVSHQYPGKLVVFSRFGPGATATGGGFSWWDYDSVVCPGFNASSHCGHLNVGLFAHEMGHFLGLTHTFPTDPFVSVQAAENYFLANGKNPAIFDGDGISDTELDPGIRTLECSTDTTVTLAGTVFTLPRHNLMSYYNESDALSPMQIQRLRWTLDYRAANKMWAPLNNPAAPKLEAEALQVTQTSGCSDRVQDINPWREDMWSDGQQLFSGCGDGGWIELRVPVAQIGLYSLDLYATLAPDFAKVKVLLDGKVVRTYDGYAPFVAPSGRIALGLQSLAAGNHTLRLQAVGKNPLASDYYIGIDCVKLTQIPLP